MADGKHYNIYSPGLERRHVDTLMISYTDEPPTFIREERGRDIFEAIRIGFEQMDKRWQCGKCEGGDFPCHSPTRY